MTCLLLPPVSVNYSYTYLRQLPTLSSISSPFQQNWMEFQLPTPIRTTEKRSICRGYLILTSRPSGRNDPIYCLSKPESVTKEECQPVEFVRCYSEEVPISQVPLEEAQCLSDEPVEGYAVPLSLLSISLTILRQMKCHKERLDPSVCQSISSLFLSTDEHVIGHIQQQLQKYIDHNPLGYQ